LLKASNEARAFGHESSDYATTLMYTGNFYMAKMDFHKSKEFYKNAIIIYNKRLKEYDPYKVTLFSNYGVCFTLCERYDKALKWINKALVIQNNNENKNGYSSYRGMLYKRLGRCYHLLEDLPLALSYFNEALEIIKRCYGEIHPDVGELYWYIGIVNQQLGDLDQAEENFIKSLNNYEKAYYLEHFTVIVLLGCIGKNYSLKSNFEKAEEFYKRYEKYSKKSNDSKKIKLSEVLNHIALIKSFQKFNEISLKYFEESKAIVKISPEIKNMENCYLFLYFPYVLENNSVIFQYFG
jgi:tetratricopeptide (TPR) repeat protein